MLFQQSLKWSFRHSQLSSPIQPRNKRSIKSFINYFGLENKTMSGPNSVDFIYSGDKTGIYVRDNPDDDPKFWRNGEDLVFDKITSSIWFRSMNIEPDIKYTAVFVSFFKGETRKGTGQCFHSCASASYIHKFIIDVIRAYYNTKSVQTDEMPPYERNNGIILYYGSSGKVAPYQFDGWENTINIHTITGKLMPDPRGTKLDRAHKLFKALTKEEQTEFLMTVLNQKPEPPAKINTPVGTTYASMRTNKKHIALNNFITTMCERVYIHSDDKEAVAKYVSYRCLKQPYVVAEPHINMDPHKWLYYAWGLGLKSPVFNIHFITIDPIADMLKWAETNLKLNFSVSDGSLSMKLTDLSKHLDTDE